MVALPAAAQAPTKCTGKFVNPITDVCWSCLFPLSVGGLKIWPSGRPDTSNPASPICFCGSPLPRIGISVGFWEPARLADVTMKPWCFPNLGGTRIAPGFDIGLIQKLGLSPETSRTHVGFMGCHGAFNGLRVAHAYQQATDWHEKRPPL